MLDDILKNLNQGELNDKPDHDLTKEELDYMYNLGVRHLQVNDHAKALPIFQLLVACDSSNALYVKALAGTFQAAQDYMSALFSYKFAYSLDNTKNLDCLFYAGVCLFNLKNYEAAIVEFEKYMENEHVNSDMLMRAKLYLDASIRHMAKN